MATLIHVLVVLHLVAVVPFTVGRPSTSFPEETTATAASTPSPTVSTVLAGDIVIANQFIEGLNLTDFTVPQRRNPELEKPPKSALTQLRELSQIITSGQTSVSTGKAHQGVAVPMTLEEMEQEMAAVSAPATVPHPVNVVKKTSAIDSSTSKDGITTWILLSGTDSTNAPEKTGNNNQKLDKIAKAKPTVTTHKPANGNKASSTVKPTAVPKTEPTKNKLKPKGTPKTTTAAPTKTTTTSEATASKPVAVNNLIVKKKVTPVLAAAAKKNETVEAAIEENEIKSVTTTTEVPITKTTPVPFLILEPKDADFNLPEDRATPTTSKPKTKRPAKGTNKKKTANKKKNPTAVATATEEDSGNTKNSTKTAVSKIKQKPMTTQLYNFLAREIMPTVGVGILGLVVTAGIAGYFLNPLGALRRSYEVADRKDDLYYYNNEEYAGPGAEGMSEEEVFGKVIAGMPAHGSTYRNGVRFGHQAQLPRPNQFQQNAQSKYASSTHGPYSRYRNVQAPQPQYNAYPSPHYGHQRNNINPNMISQKSISSQIYALPQITTTTTTSSPSTTEEVAVITTADYAPSSSESSPSIVYSQSEHSYDVDYQENNANPNELKRRTQFVVGTVIDTDDTSLKTDETAQPSPKYPSIVLPEHGPRRRRRSVPITTLTPPNTFDEQIAEAEQQYEKLRKRFETSPDLGDKKTSSQILKEMKRIDYQLTRLRRVVAEAKDIEQFQTELSLQPKNTEMCEMLAKGLAQISSDILFVTELLDEPKLANEKMSERAQMSKRIELKVVVEADNRNDDDSNSVASNVEDKKVTTENAVRPTTDSPIEYTTTPRPSFFLGFLKMMELKTAFGVNVLRSIRPAFDRAVQDVFRVNQTAYNH